MREIEIIFWVAENFEIFLFLHFLCTLRHRMQQVAELQSVVCFRSLLFLSNRFFREAVRKRKTVRNIYRTRCTTIYYSITRFKWNAISNNTLLDDRVCHVPPKCFLAFVNFWSLARFLSLYLGIYIIIGFAPTLRKFWIFEQSIDSMKYNFNLQ